MENKTQKDHLLPVSIVVAAFILGFAWVYTSGLKAANPADTAKLISEKPLAPSGEIPVVWGDLGSRMAEAGVFDKEQFLALYASRGGLSAEEKKLVDGVYNGTLKVNEHNTGLLLNLFWALGLSNKNDILEKGPMMDARYGGAGNFASTGGWTLAKGDVMDHYSHHRFISLTAEQQATVERVSKNIYRPCCNNMTYFPDCNHGMAMLGLLELLASQDAGEAQMYKTALMMNAYWFPEQYATIARYFESQGHPFQNVEPKEILSSDYSSGSGFRRISSLVPPKTEKRQGGSCGV